VTAAVAINQGAGQQKRFWFFIAALAGALSLLKGIRLPNRWSATQAQIDYSQGFVKRGFFGEFVAGPLGLGHYARFAVVSFALLALLVAMVLLFTHRSGVMERVGFEIPAVLWASYGISTMANTVGYLDIPLAILTIAVLLVKKPLVRFAVAVPVCVAALLIHEMFLFVFLPVVVLSFVVQGVREGERAALWMGALLLVLAGAIGGRLAYERPMSVSHVNAMREHVASRVDFGVREDALDPLQLGAADNRVTMYTYQTNLDYVVKQAACVLAFGPVILLLLMTMARVVKAVNAPVWLVWAGAVCALAPLAMHVFAFDVPRFNGLICLTAFLVLLVVVQFTTAPALPPSLMQQRVAVVVMLLSLSSGGLLMWRNDKMFPAYPELKKFKNQLHEMTLAQIANLSD